ncbi:MAG: hypothetical protein JXR34_07805 [Bacteroidales bacterium]|nr:hypothetical protein [Bacteroidales bacterium]
MRRFGLVLILLGFFISLKINAQEKKEKPFKFQIHGFVKSDYWYDTRQVVQSREGLFSLFPMPVALDSEGKDLNAHPSFNYSAISTRISTTIEGPDAFGAKTHAFIEGDFTGVSNTTINTLRLRHAWIRLDWKKSRLVLGQDWHPMFVTEVFPGVLALNTGAPFQPFIRNPQARFEWDFKKTTFILAALSQRDNSCNGPVGRDFSYLSNSLLPNFHGQLKTKIGKSLYGAAFDWKSIMPRMATDSGLYTSARLNSTSAMVYYKYADEHFTFKSKIIYGQNLTEHLLLGGYAIADIDTLTDYQEYTATEHLFAWGQILYTKKLKRVDIQPGLFFGYAMNLGTTNENLGIYYATGSDLDVLFRVSPSVNIYSGPMMVSLEWEWTEAFYGIPDKNGMVKNSKPVDNHRFMVGVFYLF